MLNLELKDKSRPSILLISPGLHRKPITQDPYFPYFDTFLGIREQANKYRYLITFAPNYPSPFFTKLAETAQKKPFDAILVLESQWTYSPKVWKEINLFIPVIFLLDMPNQLSSLNVVRSEESQDIKKVFLTIVKHKIKDIGLVFPSDSNALKLREELIIKEIKKNKLYINPDWWISPANPSYAKTYKLRFARILRQNFKNKDRYSRLFFRKWIKRKPLPKIIFFLNDRVLAIFKETCSELNIYNTPLLVGFDGIEAYYNFQKSIVTIKQDFLLLGKMSITLLRDILEKNRPSTNQSIYVSTKLLNNSLLTENKENNFIQQVEDYLTRHYQYSNLDIQISESLGISHSYFLKKFNKEFSIPFRLYLNKLRLSKAKEMLQNSFSSISEVYSNCGFSSHQYFCRVFKEEYGKSPSAYSITKGPFMPR